MTETTVTVGPKGLTFGGLGIGGIIVALMVALVRAPAGDEMTNMRIEVARLEQKVQGEFGKMATDVQSLRRELDRMRKDRPVCRPP